METLFATEIFQVLNVLSPSESVIKKVSQIKRDIFNQYGEFDSYTSTAHITINTYLLDSERITSLNKKLSEFFSFYPPIDIHVNGFDFWDSSKTMVLKVEDNNDLKRLRKDLNIWRKLNHLKGNYKPTDVPHITIGKNLNNQLYQELKSRYQYIPFQASFESHHVLSLSKKQFSRKYSRKILFPLENRPNGRIL